MTREFSYMMQLAAAGARGNSIDHIPADVNWDSLYELSREQNVMQFVAYAVKKSPKLYCPVELRQEMMHELRVAAFANVMHQDEMLTLLSEMEQQGFSPVLLKGYSLDQYYASPECRMSGDMDIWIDPKHEKLAYQYLESKGFSCNPRGAHEHHSVCNHPELGCVELHVFLYGRLARDIWFDGVDESTLVIEDVIRFESSSGSYTTLGYTDNLIFLTLHLLKHFIHSGMSLRMMLDVALYLKANKAHIDVDRFWDVLRKLKLEHAVQGILWIMIMYCDFKDSDFPGLCQSMPEGMNLIVDDLEQGGALGHKAKEQREQGWHAYSSRKMIKEKGKLYYRLYMLKWKTKVYRKLIFPSIDSLKHRYSMLTTKPWLLPLVWIYRLLFRGFSFLRERKLTHYTVIDEAQIAQLAKERMALFRLLKMM